MKLYQKVLDLLSLKKGDEKAWAEIEKSVLEFENAKDGEEYFLKQIFTLYR